MTKNWILSAVLSLMALAPLFSQEPEMPINPEHSLEVGASVSAGKIPMKPAMIFDDLRTVFFFSDGPFTVKTDLSFINDGKYPTHLNYELGHNFIPNDCFIAIHGGAFALDGGRSLIKDEVQGPYSLFLSAKETPLTNIGFVFDNDRIRYETRWISLNYRSANVYEGTSLPWLDRGMNYKAYSLSLGAFRFGYQDASVYVGQVFDFESFINPLPAFIQQMVLTTGGRPFSQVTNPNSLMGFFGTWTGETASAYAQFLVDDINGAFLAPLLSWAIPALNDINNVEKLAWSIGGSWESPVGKLSFHHGGATKYAFESTYAEGNTPGGFGLAAPDYDSLPYPYVYYPATSYGYQGEIYTVYPGENYIGYQHGENNLSFLIGWEGSPGKDLPWGFESEAELEYSITGSQSPANPWHELDTWTSIGKAFVMFDEPTLEHSLRLAAMARKTIKAWTFSAGFILGWKWNPLKPCEVPGRPDEAMIWKPTLGESLPVYGITLGASYKFDWNAKR